LDATKPTPFDVPLPPADGVIETNSKQQDDRQDERHDVAKDGKEDRTSAIVAVPRKDYFYIDRNGQKQGPFPQKDIVAWIKLGAFPCETLIMEGIEADYQSIAVHPHFMEIFATAEQKRNMTANILSAVANVDTKQEEGIATTTAGAPETSSSQGKRKATGARATSQKRSKGTNSNSVVQVKDAVVRSQFEMLTDRLVTCQIMTAYKEQVQAANNPEFHSLLLTYDEIVDKPDEHLEGARKREIPVWSIFMPSHLDPKDMGVRLEALGKAMQDTPKFNKKKNKPFDLEVVSTPQAFYETHYGRKRTKKRGDETDPSASP
jgi:hypothetical protein